MEVRPSESVGSATWKQSGSKVSVLHRQRVWKEACNCQGNKVPLLGNARGGRQGCHRNFFLYERAPQAAGTTGAAFGSGHKLILPYQTPEVGAA